MKFFLPGAVFAVGLLVNFVLQEFPSLPTKVQYVTDIVIGGVAAIVFARLIITRRLLQIPLRYWLMFAAFTYVVVAGIVLNSVPPDVTFAGVRFYFKYVPLFLLAFAYDYSAKDLKRLFFLLAGIALLQIPVTLRQRFIVFTDYNTIGTGDVITGTLSVSNSLSLFVVSGIVMIIAFYLDKRVTLKSALCLALLFLMPATINETKGTPLMLAVGALAVLLARRHALNWRQITLVSVAGGILLSVFVVVYDRMYASKVAGASGLVDFMSRGDVVLDRYTYKGLEADSSALSRGNEDIVGKPVRLTNRETWIGRFDSLAMPFDVLAADVTRVIFGLGVGNVSSRFGSGGEYTYLRDELGATMTTLTQLIWETGTAGALLAVILIALFARDALSLSASKSEWRTFGAGWFGAAVIALCTLIYTNYVELPEVSILLAFFAGITSAKLQQASRATRTGYQPMWRARPQATSHSIR